MAERLMLIDGNAILHKAYHGLPPFQTRQGELVNAVYGFASVILNLFNIYQPRYAVCAFDVKEKTLRHEYYEEYKGHRTKAPDDLYAQLPRIKELLTAFGVAIFEQPGYEADDIIGTISRLAEEKKIESCVITGDMDAVQLVSDFTQVFAMHKGFSKPIIYDAAAVRERYGLEPQQIADLKGLAGDNSDNIKGVMGIGGKTAKDLLVRFGSVEGIYEHIEELKGAVKAKMLAGEADALMSKRLATIIRDMDLVVDFEKCPAFGGDIEALERLFGELEFKTLGAKLAIYIKEVMKKKTETVQGSLF